MEGAGERRYEVSMLKIIVINLDTRSACSKDENIHADEGSRGKGHVDTITKIDTSILGQPLYEISNLVAKISRSNTSGVTTRNKSKKGRERERGR